jgi:hypothetical protein
MSVVPTVASASQSGLTGDPWIDQYIELVPSAGGGKPGGTHGRHKSGLSRSQIDALSAAGGDTFAAMTAASVGPVSAREAALLAGKKGSRGRNGSGNSADMDQATADRILAATATPALTATLVQSLGGSDDGGLGPVLPAALIGSLLGAVALAANRFRRNSNS